MGVSGLAAYAYAYSPSSFRVKSASETRGSGTLCWVSPGVRVTEYEDPTLETSEEEAVETDEEGSNTSFSDGFAKRISEIGDSFGLAEEFALQRDVTCSG